MTAMSALKLASYAKVMKKHGITQLNMEGLSIQMPLVEAPEKRIVYAKAEAPGDIKHREEYLESVMKLDDASLVDRMFPDNITPEAV